jgi:hypothetical protein
MKRIFLAWSLLIALAAAARAQSNNFVTITPEPSSYAWWLRAQFHPFENQVRGIPVRQIRATWCKATEFRRDLFPADTAADFEQNDAAFSIDGDFDHSKTRQTALVGVYEACGGEVGSFLLVLARPKGKPPSIRFLHEMPGMQFNILQALPDATIRVFHCMNCDNLISFRWDKSKKRFVRPKDPGEG